MPQICVISINITDMEVAKEFYCGKLGFEVSETYSDSIVQLEHAGTPLILNKVDRNTTVQYPEEAQVVIGLQTDDLIQTIVEYKSKGIEVIHDTPQPCPPGSYSAIRDPFGNVIELLEFS